MSKSVCIFTIASKNYLSQVRTLLASVAEHHPEAAVYLVLCDRVEGRFDPDREPFDIILAQDLGIERFSEMAFKYNCVELNTAIKPFAMEKFVQEYGFDRVIYFDPDILLYRRQHELCEFLDRHDVVLTPHLNDFLPDDGCLPDNQRILQTGTNNLGFIGVRRGEPALAMLRWWKRQLYDRCRHAIAEGLFVDQKWMDLAPSCVETAVLLRHPGYNTAYWNLPSRQITYGNTGEYMVNGKALAFFHFSGFNPNAPFTISKYDTRLSWSNLGKAGQTLFRNYRKLVIANGFHQTKSWPYAYGRFDDGTPIADCFRSYFHRHWAGRKDLESDAFNASKDLDTIYRRLQSPVKKGPLTGAAMALYESHSDLPKPFPTYPATTFSTICNGWRLPRAAPRVWSKSFWNRFARSSRNPHPAWSNRLAVVYLPAYVARPRERPRASFALSETDAVWFNGFRREFVIRPAAYCEALPSGSLPPGKLRRCNNWARSPVLSSPR